MKQKIKIMRHKPELSDEEIRSYMDFERLVASSKRVTGATKLYWVLKRTVPVVAITGIAVWFIFFANTNKEQPITKDVEHQESQPVQSREEQIPDGTQQEQTQENQDKTSASSVKAPVKVEKKRQAPLPPEGISEDVYIQAEPVDGYPALYDYFNTQLVYPLESIKDSIQGVQIISFSINLEGRAEKIQVKQSLGESFEKEARRLIENMPLWKPATLNGKPVLSQMSLPLTFQIQKVKIKE